MELASSPLALARGLMGRRALRPGTGMLLRFPCSGRHGIWMLGMRFAIDVVFLDGKLRVVSVVRAAKPLTADPRTWRIYRPAAPAAYALEVPAGPECESVNRQRKPHRRAGRRPEKTAEQGRGPNAR